MIYIILTVDRILSRPIEVAPLVTMVSNIMLMMLILHPFLALSSDQGGRVDRGPTPTVPLRWLERGVGGVFAVSLSIALGSRLRGQGQSRRLCCAHEGLFLFGHFILELVLTADLNFAVSD